MRPAQRHNAGWVNRVERYRDFTCCFDRDESEQVMHASELQRIRKAVGLDD